MDVISIGIGVYWENELNRMNLPENADLELYMAKGRQIYL